MKGKTARAGLQLLYGISSLTLVEACMFFSLTSQCSALHHAPSEGCANDDSFHPINVMDHPMTLPVDK